MLLSLGAGGFDIAPWADRLGWSTQRTMASGSSRSLGAIAAPPAVLIRPDGYVAWAGDLTDPELPRALSTWFGAATPT